MYQKSNVLGNKTDCRDRRENEVNCKSEKVSEETNKAAEETTNYTQVL